MSKGGRKRLLFGWWRPAHHILWLSGLVSQRESCVQMYMRICPALLHGISIYVGPGTGHIMNGCTDGRMPIPRPLRFISSF